MDEWDAAIPRGGTSYLCVVMIPDEASPHRLNVTSNPVDQSVTKPNASDSGPLVELDPAGDPRWDKFVSEQPAATAYHHSAWTRVLSQTFGHTPLYLGLLSADRRQLTGVLPLVFINSFLTGKRLVSLPLTAYCNPLMPQARLEEAIRHAFGRFRGVQYVELKLLTPHDKSEENPRLGVESPFVSQVLDLVGDIDEVFKSFHATCIRKMVRRAARRGLTFRLGDTDVELRRFYDLLVAVRRGEGLPSPPYEFYANIRRLLTPQNLFEMPVIEFNGKVIAAGVVLKGGTTWHLEYSASDGRFVQHGTNQLLAWECIRRAHQSGARHFDFGRTSLWHHSLLKYKDRWNTRRYPIRYRIFPEAARSPRWHDISDSFLVRLNKRLPTPFLKWQGRLVYSHRS